jgi:hypothetical protein
MYLDEQAIFACARREYALKDSDPLQPEALGNRMHRPNGFATDFLQVRQNVDFIMHSQKLPIH